MLHGLQKRYTISSCCMQIIPDDDKLKDADACAGMSLTFTNKLFAFGLNILYVSYIQLAGAKWWL